jgi:hypothetical protein
MSKNKSRWYPDKPQNNKQNPCPRYEEYSTGGCYCHGGWSDDAKICKGNPHNCVKTLYHRAASRSDKQINDDVFRRR